MEQTNAQPVSLTIQRPHQSSRWLALATLLFLLPKAVMLVPHFVVLYALGIVAFLCGVIAQFVVLFTGRYPQGLFDIAVGVMRWQVRVNAYVIGLTDIYPPFRLE